MPDPEETLAPILEAIGIVRRELAPEQAVVGFFGGPFTVAGYLVEGKPSREFAVTKALMYAEPEVWRALLDKLADTFAAYALAQARAGADLVQLFDSWVGNLSPADYAEFVAPWSGRVLQALKDECVPTIHFGTGTSTLLADMAATGGDVIGLDWRIPLDTGWSAVGEKARAGQPRSRRCCSARGSGSRPRCATCSRAPAAGLATSSTSATACFRAPTPTCSAACASSSTPRPRWRIAGRPARRPDRRHRGRVARATRARACGRIVTKTLQTRHDFAVRLDRIGAGGG